MSDSERLQGSEQSNSLPFFVVGDRVSHPFAGLGTVKKIGFKGNRGEENTADATVKWDAGGSGIACTKDLSHVADDAPVSQTDSSVYSTATRIVTFELEVINADLDRNDQKPAEMWTGLEDAVAADNLGLVYALSWSVREVPE